MSMLCAIAMSLTLVLPVGAAAVASVENKNFYSTVTGEKHDFYYVILDKNGIPVATPKTLPLDWPNMGKLKSGYTLELWDRFNSIDNTLCFDLELDVSIYFAVTLQSAGKVELGYRPIDGEFQSMYEGTTAATQFSTNFRNECDVNMTFTVKNISAYDITITSVHID